ncbi:glycosyltransferase family 1 protein [Clostridium perfringens]|uniref:glycosyltransferase family 1 protein n=1 Tax=Clostridium perfringens TaxID=1502 RepID=UPI003AFF8F8B
MRKILHIVGGMNIGGTETMLMNLYRKINKDISFDFISYYEREAYYDKEIESLGGKIIKLGSPNRKGIYKSIKDLCKVIREYGPYDAVHAHTLFNCGIAMIAAKICGVEVRISHAHTNLDNNISFLRKIYMTSMRVIIKIFSTNYLACSDDAGKYLFGQAITGNKNYIKLPNYIDYLKFLECNESNIRKELGISEEEIVVGHIGTFKSSKNHSFLIDIVNNMIKKNGNVRCILVGEGELKKEIQYKCRELGVEKKVYLLGLREDTEKILNSLDLFVFPSTYEGLGLVMLEAQACGLPCLVSEAIQPEADLGLGLLKKMRLKDGDNIWSEEALKLVKNKNKNKQLIEEAFENNGYDLENIINTLLKVYRIN